MKSVDDFTAEQPADWRIYEAVRKTGAYNMLADPAARVATGLSRLRYWFALKRYVELKAAVNKKVYESSRELRLPAP